MGVDNKIVVVGDVNGQGQDFGIARFLPDGGLDTSFNGTGRLQSSMSSSHDYARDVIVLADDKILVGGDGINGRNYDFILSRFNVNGTRDGSFGNNGVTTTNFDGSGRQGGSEDQASVMLRRPDGRILLIGSSNLSTGAAGPDAIALAQYSESGTLDPNFKVLSLASTIVPGGYLIHPTSAALDTSGGLVVAGWVKTSWESTSRVFVVRFDAAGVRDTAFGTVTFDRTLTDTYSLDDQIAIQSDGKIVVAFLAKTSTDPSVPSHVAIARLNANGTADVTFGTAGIREYADELVSNIQSLAIQPDGKLVVGGLVFVNRYLLDGTPDATFGDNGQKELSDGAYLLEVRDFAIRSDGKFVLASSTMQPTAGSGQTDFGVVRLEGDTPSAPMPAGITAVPAANVTKEVLPNYYGGTWLRMILNAQPTANVVIGLSSSDTTEGVPLVSSVMFTPSNWNVPQLVEIFSVDDTVVDGNQPYTIALAPAISVDPAYSGMDAPDFNFTNQDNETKGGKKLMASAIGNSPLSSPLLKSQIQPILREVFRQYRSEGVDLERLAGIQVATRNLPGATLGETIGKTIYVDRDAAGWGWFVDRTPGKNSEFTAPGNQGEQNRMDLLSVLMHEFGHVLGHDHEEGGVMADTLAAGQRLGLDRLSVEGIDWFGGGKKRSAN